MVAPARRPCSCDRRSGFRCWLASSARCMASSVSSLVHTVLRVIGLNPPRSVASAPLALIRARDPVLAFLLGHIPLVSRVVRHLLLGLTVCLQDLLFVAIISMAPSPWPDLCGDHRSPAFWDRWLSSPSLLCARTCALQLGYALTFFSRPRDPSLQSGMLFFAAVGGCFFVFLLIVFAILQCLLLCVFTVDARRDRWFPIDCQQHCGPGTACSAETSNTTVWHSIPVSLVWCC